MKRCLKYLQSKRKQKPTISSDQYMLIDIEGNILNGIFHFNRLKQAYVTTTKGPVNTLVHLKHIIHLGISINKKNGIV